MIQSLPANMQAVSVRETGSFQFEQRPVPQPGPGEVLLRVTVTGLCRTDLKIIQVGHRDLLLPRIPGEEVVGKVVALGPQVDPTLLHQRCYVYPGEWCGTCPACSAGAENLCRFMQIMGFHRDGGFAGYVVAPIKSLIPLPEGLSDEQAVFAEPLSCCLNALELARLALSETIAVWGGGPAGQLLARAASSYGALPTVIEPDQARRELAHGLAGPPDQLFDVCVVAVGNNEAYQQALDRLAPRGRLVVFSGLSKETTAITTDFNQLHYLEQTIVGAYGCCYRHGRQAINLLQSGRLEVRDLISHRLPLSRLAEALELVASRQCMKIHLYPEA
ncbi:MAG: alcohol dehydrogenase catalytic domain-containing protein [Geobacter sp.]|nr:alcohol dehydrogenase catalytic domain-containing protein [Geobacter sp.]